MFEAVDVIEYLNHAETTSLDPIRIYWVCVDDKEQRREQLRQELLGAGAHLCILPVVLRAPLFTNANAVGPDAVRIIEEHRDQVIEILALASGPLLLLILSRTPMSISQAHSPVELPVWFPRRGGAIVSAYVEDITWKADNPINSPYVRRVEISKALWELEGVLLARLRLEAKVNSGSADSLYDGLLKTSKDPPTIALFLDQADKEHSNVVDVSGFRPSSVRGNSLLGRIIGAVLRRSPDQLPDAGEKLACALGVPTPSNFLPMESLVAVLLRPTSQETGARRFGRDILILVYASYQICTAAAHFDDYRKYPVLVLQAFSADLLTSLWATIDFLKL